MRRVSLIGVVLGGVADIVATAIMSFPIMVVAAMKGDLISLPKDEQTRAIMQIMQGTPSLYAAGFVLGAICSVFGGYLAARIARRATMLNGALSAWLCVGLGVYAMATGQDSSAPSRHLLFFALSPALGALGGYLRLRQQGRDDRQRLAPVS